MKLVKMTQPFVSDRFDLGEEIGRGHWGIVYKATDRLTNEEVAIKVFSPTDTALAQADYRKLELEEIVQKERLSLQPSTRLVPRFVMQDDAGKPFLVMNFWPTWLSGVMKEREASQGVPQNYWIPQSPLLPSGFREHEVIHLAKELAAGLSELHGKYRRAHCDIKPDNLVYDNGRILISDFGTSTYAAASTPNRDNMGHLYTRALRLFIPGQHPDMHTDAFSAGALIYKLFTGKYPFEEEINEHSKDEGGMSRFVRQFYDERPSGYCIESMRKIRETIDSKLADPNIPDAFKDPIRAALECHHSTDHLHTLLTAAEERHQADVQGAREKKQARDDLKGGVKLGLLGGVSIATGLLTLIWMTYFGSPNFDSRPDFETRASRRKIEDSEIRFELEKCYHQPIVALGTSGYEGMKAGFDEVQNARSLMDRITSAWLHTIDEMKYSGEDAGFDFRYHQVFHNGLRFGRHASEGGKLLRDNETEDGKIMPAGYASLQYRRYFQHAFKTYTLDGHLVDLEDSTMLVCVGLEKLNKAQKITNSTQYSVYKHAMYDGAPVIPQNTRLVAERFFTNLSHRMPQLIRYKEPGTK